MKRTFRFKPISYKYIILEPKLKIFKTSKHSLHLQPHLSHSFWNYTTLSNTHLGRPHLSSSSPSPSRVPKPPKGKTQSQSPSISPLCYPLNLLLFFFFFFLSLYPAKYHSNLIFHLTWKNHSNSTIILPTNHHFRQISKSITALSLLLDEAEEDDPHQCNVRKKRKEKKKHIRRKVRLTIEENLSGRKTLDQRYG